MKPMVNRVLSALLLSIILTGCATTSNPGGSIKTVLLYPPIPYEKLSCQLEPSVPDKGGSQETFAIWAENTRAAGEECRSNLDYLRAFILTWESKVDQSDIWVEEGDDY